MSYEMEPALNGEEKVFAGLGYLTAFFLCIPPLLIYLLRKDNTRALKLHLMQSIGLTLFCMVVNIAFWIMLTIGGNLPVLNWVLVPLLMLANGLFSLAFLVYMIILAVKAFQGDMMRVPVLSDYIQNSVLKD